MLISELGYGGAEGAFLRLAHQLKRFAEVEIAVFAEHYDNKHYTQTHHGADLPVHVLNPGDRQGRWQRWRTRAERLTKIRTAMAVDATISFLSGPNLLNVLSKGPGLRIVSIRGSRQFDAHAGALANITQHWTTDRLVSIKADAIVPVSRGLAGEIERNQPTSRGKVHPIVGYVDSERLLSGADLRIEPEFEALAATPLIVAAGRLSTEKGFHHLLRVFARVKRERHDARLLLIGDGPMRSELLAEAEALGLSAGDNPTTGVDVVMPGYRAVPHRYFRLASAFALTSASEGFPNILVEALASGVRVIAADVPWGAREILGLGPEPSGHPYPTQTPTQTPYGVLMPPINSGAFDEAWTATILELFANSRDRSSSKGLARQRVRELDCSIAAESWIGLVQHLAGDYS